MADLVTCYRLMVSSGGRSETQGGNLQPRGLVSEVGLEPGEDPVPRRCVVNMNSVESVSVAILVERLGRLTDTRMRQICAPLAVAVDRAD